ncbi:MAG: hypothetical protein LOD84_10910 [Limnochordales bacterium]
MTQRLMGIIAGIAAIVLGVAVLMGGAGFGGEVLDEVSRSFALAPGQELVIRGWNGPITYGPWEGDEVRIAATAETGGVLGGLWRLLGGQVTVNFVEDERGVAARADASGGLLGRGSVKVRFHVAVPRDWSGRVALTTSNGPINAAGLAGDAALRTSNGAIQVRGLAGTLEARTTNGTIQLADVDGRVEAVTTNGPVKVLGGTLAGSGRVQTTNGGIELRAALARDGALPHILAAAPGRTPRRSPSRSMPVSWPKPNCLLKSCRASTPISGPKE